MKRNSIVWTIDRDDLQKVVSKSQSIADILRHFGLVCSGASYKPIKARMKADNIDYSHIRLGIGSNAGRKFDITKAIPLDEVMVENSSYHRGHLKKRLLKSGMLKNECSICGRMPQWEGKPLVMVLDHINGVSNDHRASNLRLVCPNCDSQLDTTKGKNKRAKKHCAKCGKVIDKNSSTCRICRSDYSKTFKVRPENRPSKDELSKMVSEMPMTTIGKKYGVSDNAIRKWCKAYGIVLERRLGFWSKQNSGAKLID